MNRKTKEFIDNRESTIRKALRDAEQLIEQAKVPTNFAETLFGRISLFDAKLAIDEAIEAYAELRGIYKGLEDGPQ